MGARRFFQENPSSEQVGTEEGLRAVGVREEESARRWE